MCSSVEPVFVLSHSEKKQRAGDAELDFLWRSASVALSLSAVLFQRYEKHYYAISSHIWKPCTCVVTSPGFSGNVVQCIITSPGFSANVVQCIVTSPGFLAKEVQMRSSSSENSSASLK
jgi:hypothetical protein